MVLHGPFGTTGNSIFRGPTKVVHTLADFGPTDKGLTIQNEGSNDHFATIYVYNDNGEVGIFTDQGNGFNGQIGGFDANTGSYYSVSDSRTKKDIEVLPSIYNKIGALRPVSYTFKNNTSEVQDIGFLAQELNDVFPEFVSYNKKQDLYTVNYAGLSTVAIKGIQELQEENKLLKERLDKLEKHIYSTNK